MFYTGKKRWLLNFYINKVEIQTRDLFFGLNKTVFRLYRLWHTTNIYLHPTVHEYAEKLVATLPGDLKVCKLS